MENGEEAWCLPLMLRKSVVVLAEVVVVVVECRGVPSKSLNWSGGCEEGESW